MESEAAGCMPIEGAAAEEFEEPAASHENLGNEAMALSESQEEAIPVGSKHNQSDENNDKNNFEKLQIRIQKLKYEPIFGKHL